MEKLNEYLQSLIAASGYELHLEPNKPPYLVTSNGISEISGGAVLGTQISQIVFPIIPHSVKQELPNKSEIEFVFPHNLGNFNFTVKKSPAGFMVTVKPLIQESVPPVAEIPQMSAMPEIAPSVPTISQEVSIQNSLEIPTPFEEDIHSTFAPPVRSSLPFEVPSPVISQIPAPIVQEISPPVTQPQTFEFESASYTAQLEIQSSYQSPEIIPEEPRPHSQPQITKIETASVNDPEFITTFSDTSTYDEPGSKYDYGVEVIPQANYVEDFQLPQSYQQPEIYQPDIQNMQPLQPSQYYVPAQTSFVEPAALPSFAPATVNLQAKKAIDELFYKMAAEKASDLHMSVSVPPMIRKDGKMQFLQCNEDFLSPERIKELLTSIMPPKNQEEFARRNDTDFAYEIPELARFRANIFMDRKGMGGVFRIIPTKILTAEQLGLSKAIMDLCNLSKGLVVVTGPTGSGKSTTLCAMVDHINKHREDHIITIEDPIEFTHENQKCLVNQREVHNHTDSFKDALRAALREDPDILLVGEMRDLETISIAIETAETGHLVFGTLHTTTAPSTIDRIIDQFPADRQQQIRVMLSESLKGVIAQTLLPKKGGGRVAALEVLIVTPAISNLIREGKTFQIASAMQTGKNIGMVMLNDALMAHVQSGAVEPRDAYIKAVDKTNFESLLTRNGFRL
jgi:pilus retraction protein PilT